ncbi:MAG: Fe-S oxidoreductase [Parcubacteria group bacterium Gr01-1014_31]|nr:MAG: Fe-S oxidoreductase [Parcubacteria group bacterium Gr01-1014_31]
MGETEQETPPPVLSTPVVYGPVASRRLGRSLGINLFTPASKVCTFDCAYCQCGAAQPTATGILSLARIKRGLSASFRKLVRFGTPIQHLTFAGNGEPTIHPDFPEIVAYVLRLRDRLLPGIPTAIFTNGSALGTSAIRSAIAKLDRRFLKLDAGDPQTARRVNRSKNFAAIVHSLAAAAKEMPVEISTAVITAPARFANLNSLRNLGYVRVVQRINPQRLYLYSIDRPPAVSVIEQASPAVLLQLATYLRSRLDVPVLVLRSRRTRPWAQWIWE